MRRTLRLRRESLGSLSANELTGVAGGAYSGDGRFSCVLRECADVLPASVEWSGLTLCPHCYTEAGA